MPRNCRSNKATPTHNKVAKLIQAEVARLGDLLIKLEERRIQKQEHDFKMGDLLIHLLTMSNEEEGNKKKEFAIKQKKAFEYRGPGHDISSNRWGCFDFDRGVGEVVGQGADG